MLPFFRKYLDNVKGKAGSIDALGGGLLAVAVAVFLLAITQMQVWLFLGGLVTLVFFVLRIRKAEEPFIKPSLFRNKTYSMGLTLAFATTAMSFSMVFLTPQFLAAVNGLSPANIGFVLVRLPLLRPSWDARAGGWRTTAAILPLFLSLQYYYFLLFPCYLPLLGDRHISSPLF